MERLTTGIYTFQGKVEDAENQYLIKVQQKLKEYEDLEEQGLLIRLHCKRGDTVYFIKSAFSVAAFPIEAKVTSVCGLNCDNDAIYSAATKCNGIDRKFKNSDIGKTVFLTQAEAEEALKRMEDSDAENI